jgi:hypothetical protein
MIQGYLAVILLVAIIFIYLAISRKYESFAVQQTLARGKSILQPGFAGLSDGALTVDTIPNHLKDQLNAILGQILNSINAKVGKRYFLRKIDRVNVQPIKKGTVGCELQRAEAGELMVGVRYTVDFFAHELLNQETRRFIVIFVLDKSGNVQVEHFNMSNAFSYPNKVFTDPKDLPDPEMIILDTPLESGAGPVMGKETAGLDFSQFKPEGGEKLNRHVRADTYLIGKVFLPGAIHAMDGVPSDSPLVPGTEVPVAAATLETDPRLRFPARKHGKWWDANGVALVEDARPDRIGLDHAIENRPEQIYDNPTVARQYRDRYDDSITMFARNWGVRNYNSNIMQG